MRRIRRAFVCLKCRRRVFLEQGDPLEMVPDCEEHGPMVRQANVPYKGEWTGVGDPVPPAKDFPQTRARHLKDAAKVKESGS